MTDDHCDHCASGCNGDPHRNAENTRWWRGRCPICGDKRHGRRHCEHCLEWCDGGSFAPGMPGWPERFHDCECAHWHTGHCPACAERERIVAWMRAKTATVVFIGDTADAIEEGKHLNPTMTDGQGISGPTGEAGGAR